MNVKTGEILALEVTDERVHDGKELKALVERVLARGKNVGVKSVLADGAYDSNANFRFLDDERIKPAIRVRRNSVASTKNSNTRNGEVWQQTKDFLKWKGKRRCGKRWMAETAFSSIRRTFGEHASATRFQNMVKEMMLKASLCNLFTRLA